MNPATNKIYLLLSKTVQLEMPCSTYVNVNRFVDFPVSCDGHHDDHSWELRLTSSSTSCDEEGDPAHYLAYSFSLLLKPKDDFKYVRSFSKIKISGNVNSQDKVMVEKTKDIPDLLYNHFRYDIDINRTLYNFQSVKVEVTLQSYPIETPTRTPLKWFLDNAILTDVVIKTKDKDFPCHKFLLASVSEYFRKMFDVDLKENNESVVNWVNVYDADVVHDFLHYIYTGQTTPNFAATSWTLLAVAHVCLMDGLKRLCAYQLKNFITLHNMGDFLQTAVKYESQDLQEFAVNFIVRNYDLNGESPPPWAQLESEIGTLAIGMLKTLITKKTLF